MRLVQFTIPSGERAVAQVEAEQLRLIKTYDTLYTLATAAIHKKSGLEPLVLANLSDTTFSYDDALTEGRLLPPIDHPDAAHCLVTGTGLTHLDSAQSRDKMHAELSREHALTDSMKMFKLGLEGGTPAPHTVGVTPEWFYKGDGQCVVGPEQPFTRPAFALDSGDEAEIVGVYLIGADGFPYRLGYAVGNEFSDHVLEKQNYLYLAHSKLRACSFGPELNTGALPDNLRGSARILRQGTCVWQADIATGEANMVHALSNLEHHHFKYAQFRRPGDLHIHYFGAAALSFNDGISAQDGDVFEIAIPDLGRPLRNPLKIDTSPEVLVQVRSL